MIENYLLNTEELLNIWILLDLNVTVQPRDYQLIEWLNNVKLPFQIIATKSDKLGYGAIVKRVKKIEQELNCRDEIKTIPYSSKKHTGREILLERMSEMLNLVQK
jgi:GTP-binding protein